MTLSITNKADLFPEIGFPLNRNPNKVSEGLLFIPDISGFTHFVENTDIQTGSQITADLLSTLVESNQLGLKVSEIEGDAVLFYRYGPAPSIQEVMNQAQMMLEAFQSRIHSWQLISDQASKLSLKLIVHYGPLASISVGNSHNKLYGRTVVEAHRLLKNDIDADSYLLMTDSFLSSSSHLELGSALDVPVFNHICQTYDNLGRICYTFLPFP